MTVVASGADRGIGRTTASLLARLKLAATPEALIASKSLFAPNATQRNRVCRELIDTEASNMCAYLFVCLCVFVWRIHGVLGSLFAY